jgi:glycosyltransferase involved in cell wall biosynthesis
MTAAVTQSGHQRARPPTITVLMPVRDTPAPMLDQAIDSILTQTFTAFEFLILDDGSRDVATIACLERRAVQDGRIRLETMPPLGLTRALNRGLEHARGEFIARQDADDWSESRRLELQLAFLRAHPEAALCGTCAWTHQQDGTPLWRTHGPVTHAQIHAAFSRQNPFVHGSTMFRRDPALHIGGYREEFPCAQDYDFFWRLSETADAANLAEALYHYRYSGGAVSARRAADQGRAHRAAQMLASARRRGEPEDVGAALAALMSAPGDCRARFRASLRQADHRLLAGEYRQALKEYAELLRSHPASGVAWMKLVRCVIFMSVPAAREMCFR